MNIKRSNIKGLLEANDGKIFTVVFTKKDGSVRTMNCRTSVKLGVERQAPTTAHLKQYQVVFDMQAHDWRNINLDTVRTIKLGGAVFNVVE